MHHVFIAGGGDADQSKGFDQLFKQQLAGKRILYIPWAFYPSTYNACLEWIDNVFPKDDGYMVEILHETEYIDIDHISNNYDGMYIGGGNTFRLLKLIKDTGLDHVIRAFLAAEKPIYGGSAGAIILGKDIHTSPDVNVTKLSFHESVGFNLFAGHSIFCHYTDAYDLEIYDYIAHYQFPVIALPEGVGVYMKHAVMYIGGHTSAYLFTAGGKKEIMPGEHV